MKYGWSRTITYGKDYEKHYVSLWRQPWRRWVIAEIYHWYDSWIYKVPGFKALERWQHNRQDDDFYIPWSNRQDLRCDHLSRRQREVLATLQVTEEQYKMLARP